MADPQTPIHTTVLTLDTLTDRKCVEIDQQRYALRPIDALSLFDYKRMVRYGERMAAILHAPETTDAEEREFNDLLDTMMRLALEDIPAEVIGRLRLPQRLSIWRAFQTLSPNSLPSAGAPGLGAAADPSTISSSSLDSPASTLAPTPVTG